MPANVANNKVSGSLHIKILTTKKVLQRLPIALAQAKADNTIENLLSKVFEIKYSLYQTK